jgi:4-amino-4-deoxy-L-arabinose transferase-like glycosyltransferase
MILYLCMAREDPNRWLEIVGGALALASVSAGPAAYSLTPLGTVTGTIATAGPLPGGPTTGDGNAKVSQELVNYLERRQGSARYLVAVNGSVSAAPFILQSGKPVIAMGGFTEDDPVPTVAEFKALVARGEVHDVYISTGGGAPRGTSSAAVDSWVKENGVVVPSSSYGGASQGMTLYDLSNTPPAH